jgi:MFS family permease
MGGFAWGAILGSQLDRLGPRATCLAGAACLGTGFSLAALSVQTESLPLLYLGGAVWGIANAWAYVPPVSTLIKWFPERKGFATGMCLVGYGGGEWKVVNEFEH